MLIIQHDASSILHVESFRWTTTQHMKALNVQNAASIMPTDQHAEGSREINDLFFHLREPETLPPLNLQQRRATRGLHAPLAHG